MWLRDSILSCGQWLAEMTETLQRQWNSLRCIFEEGLQQKRKIMKQSTADQTRTRGREWYWKSNQSIFSVWGYGHRMMHICNNVKLISEFIFHSQLPIIYWMNNVMQSCKINNTSQEPVKITDSHRNVKLHQMIFLRKWFYWIPSYYSNGLCTNGNLQNLSVQSI